MASSDNQRSIHVLLVPFPFQGHINPLLQFGKRLASHGGVRCTLAATRFVLSSTKPTPSSVHVAVFSDGCDGGGPDELGGIGAPYFERFESVGSETLDALLRSESEQGRPVHAVVYDAFLPWVLGVARRHGAACAAFLTQTCAVDILHAHTWAGRLLPPPLLRPEEIRGLDGLSCELEMSDMPTFLTDASYHPSFRELLVNQFMGLDTADHVLVNSFYDLEPQEADYLASTWKAKMVGPSVPSAFLDNRIPDDMSYGIHLHTPMAMESKVWLDAQEVQSVLYVSFGSMASLDRDQTTNAKYIQDVWRVGVRVRPDAKGVVRSKEVERCVREVMEGELCKEFRMKALDWSTKAKKCMSEGGTSDVNILDFLSSVGRTAHMTHAN